MRERARLDEDVTVRADWFYAACALLAADAADLLAVLRPAAVLLRIAGFLLSMRYLLAGGPRR